MPNVLVLNGGSSSIKAVLHKLDGNPPDRPPVPAWDARVDWGRHPGKALIAIRKCGNVAIETEMKITREADVLDPVLNSLSDGPAKVLDSKDQVDVVGHRVVHGGRAFRDTTRITPEVKKEIARLAEYAPEHNRLELEAIEATERDLGPAIPQIAVFDTAFHATMPAAAAAYPGPYAWFEQGIRRYGFHGISHRYVSRRAAGIIGRSLDGLRMIICHLGNGASLAAVLDGKSIDTTMGFTPLEGLTMGSRSGSIDPGIIIHLVRNLGYGADQLDRILNKESGLLGVSGVSADMRDVLAAIEQGNARAQLAFDVYLHRLCRLIGAMAASLGGLDALVFTAGIGENCPPLREQACRQLAFLGIDIDTGANNDAPVDKDIARPDSRVRVIVAHTDEDWAIARECVRLLSEMPTR
jgi:acetate kinase